MRKRFIFSGLILLLFLAIAIPSALINVQAAPFAETATLILYDAASGTIPSESLMDFTDFPPGASSISYADGVTVMDSTASGNDTYAGWVAGQAITPGFPVLDRTAGIQMNFTLQVDGENHRSDKRAGFSVIVLDQAAQGIELSFWENEIWAQNDDRTGGLFTHGEGTAFATTSLTDYQLNIVGDTYTLTANSIPVLSGPVRDYSGFDGFPDPYETPNFLFLGDDTSAAQGRIRLKYFSVTGTQPILPTSTSTSVITSSPSPMASFTPLPVATPSPLPTQTPTGKIFDYCPSGWLLLAVVIPATWILRRDRRAKMNS